MKSIKKYLALFSAIAVLAVPLSGCKKAEYIASDYITQTQNLTFSKYSEKEFSPVELTEEQEQKINEFKFIKENKFVSLYFNSTNAAIAVFDKRYGKMWFSNNPDMMSDSVIDFSSMGLYQSQLMVTYVDGQNTKTLDSFSASVEKGEYEFETNEEGLAVTYRFIDNAQVNDKSTPKQIFQFTMQYTIDEESLIVTVPMEKAIYDSKMPPQQVDVLPHFGSCTNESDGYILIPDGSGALIKFNDDKFSSNKYVGNVYGYDESLDLSDKPLKTYSASMPIFGVKDNQNGFLAIIEDGAAFSRVCATRAGALSSYSEVYPSFNTFSAQKISIGNMDTGSLTGTQATAYKGTLRMRYSFLDTQDSEYSGMATYYRDYLTETAGLKQKEISTELPLNLELTGAIDKLKSTLGIKYTGNEALTTTQQAQDILNELIQNNIKSINLRYTGWTNGGLKQELPLKVKPESVIGGKSGIKELSKFAKDNNIGFYPSIDFMTTTSKSRGFNKFNMAAKQIDQKEAKVYTYDFVTLEDIDYRYALSPFALNSSFMKFNKSYQKLGIQNLCVDNIGSKVLADYKKSLNIDREMTVNTYIELLKSVADNYDSVMLDGGYAYSAPFADVAINTPFYDSGFMIADCSVPFYQLVFHGSLVYSGEPLNLTYDYETAVLKTIEFGGAPYFQLMAANGHAVKNTDYTYYCSNNYSIWKEKLISCYEEVSEALNKVQNSKMINHRQIADGVYQTQYDNNISVLVNYGDCDYVDGNIKVCSKSWAVSE